MEVLGTPGLLELGGRTRDMERAAPIQQKLVKVRNKDPESTTKEGLEESTAQGQCLILCMASWQGYIWRGEETTRMVFLEKNCLPGQMAQPASKDYKPLWESLLYG